MKSNMVDFATKHPPRRSKILVGSWLNKLVARWRPLTIRQYSDYPTSLEVTLSLTSFALSTAQPSLVIALTSSPTWEGFII